MSADYRVDLPGLQRLIDGAAANHNDVPPPAAPRLLPSLCLVESAPSAAGDGIPEPFGWSLIKDMVGWAWPNGHQDQLHSAETAWHTAAADFRLLAAEVPQAISLLSSSQSDEIPTATATCNDRKSDLTDLGDICQLLGEACGTYATQLDEAHHKILAELKEFAIETGIAEGAFALLTPFTAGLSEWIGNTALGARLAVKARRIATIIAELATKAREITTRLGKTLLERVGSLAEKVGKWIEEARTSLMQFARRMMGKGVLKDELDKAQLAEWKPTDSGRSTERIPGQTRSAGQHHQLLLL
ncbi:hypothetical protein ACIP5Y_05995 [Nocardia sp. NPDC088792]|uniref:WXG100-like domain-containing protein n=1 Tax=Nocardia sp. NPDC088792 TaxID=3364332 RepID=UPI0038187099